MFLFNTLFIGFIFTIISFTKKTKCQDTNSLIDLNKEYNGTISQDDSYKFYKIVIPNDIEKDSKNLIFKVHEPEAAREGREDFSDPDIFISTVRIKLK